MKMFKKSALVLAMTATAGFAYAEGQVDVAAGAVIDGDQVYKDAAITTDFVDAGADGTGPVFLDSLIAGSVQQIDLDVVGAAATGEVVVDKTRRIAYAPNTDIGENSTVTFEVTNGLIKDKGNLALEDASGNLVANLIDFSDTNVDVDGDGTGDVVGLTSLRFQVAASTTLAAGSPYFMVYDSGAATATVDPSPVVITNSGLAIGSKVQVAVTSAQDPSAIPITQGTASAETIVEVVNGTSVNLDQVVSTINVEADPSRSKFVVDEGDTTGFDGVAGVQAEAETNLTVSRASLAISIGAEIGPDLTNDAFTLELARSDLSGVTGVNLERGINLAATPATSGTDVPLAAGTGKYTLTGTDASVLNGTHNLEISVDGTSVLKPGDWALSLTANDDETGGAGTVTVADEVVSHVWDINGAQFKIPYHAQNAGGFVFFFKVVNETVNDASVAADVIVENVSQGTRQSIDGVDLGVAAAEGNTTIGQAAIKDAVVAAGGTMNDEDVYHVHMDITVNAPQNEIQVAAFQKDAAGRTAVPVYINTNNGNDGRKWQQ